MSLPQRIRATLIRHAKDEAFLGAEGAVHWREVQTLADQLGSQHAGAARIGLVAHTRPWEAAMLVAAMSLAKTVVMIHPLQSASAVVSELDRLGLDLLAADASVWSDDLLQACAAETITALALTRQANIPLRVLQADGMSRIAAKRATTDIAVETLTSGTTGQTKRIAVPTTSLEQTVDDVLDMSRQAGDDADSRAPFVEYMPLFAIGGVYYSAMAGVSGRPLLMQERFSARVFGDAIKRYRPKMVGLNPTLMRMVIDADITRADLSSLVAVRSGSAPLDADTRAAWEARYAIPILHVYGATEFYGPVTGWTLADYRANAGTDRGRKSAGRPRPGMQLRVTSEDRALPAGQIGTLTVKADRAGPDWVATSDLASLDSDGFLYLHGRADDAINRGGYKILPSTIENVLRKHPAVRDAAATGIRDQRLGDIPVAAVQLRDGAVASVDELRDFARNHLLAYQVPAKIQIVPELPRTMLLKVARESLRALFAEPSGR